jgi:HPr kinase/phosphorylase
MVMHGLFMNIFGLGTLITGESGSGKSELALSLLDRGHQLIADDAPQFELDESNKILIGSCPAPLQNLLEIRGLGIFDLTLVYGQRALIDKQKLSLVVALQKTKVIERKTHDQPSELRPIMNVNIPHITLPYERERSLDVIVEMLVRYHLHKIGAM